MSVSVDHELHIECACAGRCTAIVIRDWFRDDSDWDYEPWIEMWTRVNARASFWWRLKTAVKAVLRRDHYCDALTLSVDDLKALREFADDCLSRVPNSQKEPKA